YTIPGFWSGAQPQLHLVRGGKVVATASPQSIDRGAAMMGLDMPAAMHRGDGLSAVAVAPDMHGALEPGASLDGEYLWRDVDGCGTFDALQDVAPGTYTVLVVHPLSVSNHQMGIAYGVPEPAIAFEGSDLGDGLMDSVAPD